MNFDSKSFDNVRRHAGHISSQLLFALAVAVCIVLGVVGLVLPIIPGLLFLTIAAMLLAPHIPALNAWMHRSPVMSAYLEEAQALRTLNLGNQLRLGALLSLRMLIDGARYLAAKVSELFSSYGRQHLHRAGSRRGYSFRAF